MTGIYVRQSIDKKDSISIESQIEKCLPEIEDGYEVYEDKGFSGKNTKRPAFLKLMEDVTQGKIHKIVVYRLDRFSRSITDFSRIWDILHQYQVAFVSINEKFDTMSPMGRAMLHIIMVFAQLERETIAERVRDNYYMRAKQGAWTGGPAPFGFSVIKQQHHEKKIAILKQNENIQWVQWIFQMYCQENVSLSSIAKEIQLHCQERKWNNTTISRILKNPVYVKCTPDIYKYYMQKEVLLQNPIEAFQGDKGGLLLGKREGKQSFSIGGHQGIVEAEVFLQCQYKLEKNHPLQNKGKGKYTFLSGFLKCGICGYSLKVIVTKGHRYLVCSGKLNYHIPHDTTFLSLSEIEEKFLQQAPKKLQEVPKKEEDFLRLQKIQQIEEKISRLMQRLSESSTITMEYVNEEIQKWEQEKQNLLQTQMINQSNVDISTYTFLEKKQIASLLLEKIVVFSEHVQFFWKSGM